MKRNPYLTITLFYLIGSVFLPDNKTFFAWSTLLFLAFFFVTNSFFEAIIYSFFPLSLFSIGQLYQYIVVPPKAAHGLLYSAGRSLFFTLSPFYLFLIICIVSVFLISLKFKKFVRIPLTFSLFLITIFLSLYSAFQSRFLPTLAVLNLLTELGIMSWGITLLNYCKNVKKKKFILNILLTQIMIILVFHSGIALLQTVKRATLKIKIEQTEQIPYFGAGADENSNAFRPIGLRSDANTLANDLLMVFCSLLLLWVYLGQKTKTYFHKYELLVSSTVAILVILICQGRSVYLGLFFGGLILYLVNRKKIQTYIPMFLKRIEPFKFSIVLIIFVFSVMIGDRLWRSQFSFGESGGYTVRTQLIDVASTLIQQNWWWGVGNEMFIPAAFQNNPLGIMRYFPEAVHNGFYLFLTERGVLSSSMMIISFYWLTRKVIKLKTGGSFKWVYASTLVAQMVAMLFQPFNNFITIYVILSLVLVEVYQYE